jgi:putative PIN family toxin of toxin-antitoxin system
MPNKVDRVVIDTNLWISFLISNTHSKLDKLIEANKIKLIFSNELLYEFMDVVARPKLKKYFTSDDVNSILTSIQNHSDFVTVKSHVDVCRDKKDNFLLALCNDGKADYLLTGDEDLLVLKKYKKTVILKIADYLHKK